METFSFNPPIKFSGEEQRFLAVTCSKATKSVFIITDENNSFSITSPGQWSYTKDEDTINKLQKVLVLRSQNYIELHVGDFEKRCLMLRKVILSRFWNSKKMR